MVPRLRITGCCCCTGLLFPPSWWGTKLHELWSCRDFAHVSRLSGTSWTLSSSGVLWRRSCRFDALVSRHGLFVLYNVIKNGFQVKKTSLRVKHICPYKNGGLWIEEMTKNIAWFMLYGKHCSESKTEILYSFILIFWSVIHIRMQTSGFHMIHKTMSRYLMIADSLLWYDGLISYSPLNTWTSLFRNLRRPVVNLQTMMM